MNKYKIKYLILFMLLFGTYVIVTGQVTNLDGIFTYLNVTGSADIDGNFNADGLSTLPGGAIRGRNWRDLADGAYDGDTTHVAIKATVTIGDFLYQAEADSYAVADKDSTATAGVMYMALASGSDGDVIACLEPGGYYRNDTLFEFSNFEGTAAQIYLGDDGVATQSVGGYTTNDVYQVLGYALEADIIKFNPSVDFSQP